MDYYFLDFQFNSQTLILTRAGDDVPIRNNEARLLAFFLSVPEQVLSKDVILEHVWVGKVVSDQAVFQAISNLRALFGEGAIKTFPKKGYQWQISLGANPLAPTEPEAPPRQTTLARHFVWRWSLAAIVLGFTGAFLSGLIDPTGFGTRHPTVILAPFAMDSSPASVQAAQGLQQMLTRSDADINIRLASSLGSPEQLLASPEHFFSRYQQSGEADLLVVGRLWLHGSQVHLAYYLQGNGYKWPGYIAANSAGDAARQLQQLLEKLVPVKLLWTSKDRRLLDAQLQLLHNQYPQDLAIHHQLIDNLLQQGDNQAALLQAKELEQNARTANSAIYQTRALLIQASASWDNPVLDQNVQLMDRALALVDAAVAPFLQSEVLQCYAGIHYQQNNFSVLEQKLLRALEQAQLANAPEQQAQVLRSLAVFSHKFKQTAKRDQYLAQARAMFNQYEFPAESQALLDDIDGMFAQDPAQQELFYRAALERFKPEQDAWIKERAQEHLVNLFLSQQRWDDALNVFAQEQILSGAERVMQARVYWAQQKLTDAQTQAEAGFKQASLSGEYVASLDAALLLLQLHEAQMQPELQQQYRDFIQKNASRAWRQSKLKPLTALGLAVL